MRGITDDEVGEGDIKVGDSRIGFRRGRRTVKGMEGLGRGVGKRGVVGTSGGTGRKGRSKQWSRKGEV